MKSNYLIHFSLVLSAFLLVSIQSMAQYTTIVDKLKADIAGEGKISILADDKVNALIGKCIVGDEPFYLKVGGFRVNVFSGNSREAKETALSRERMIKERFPEVSTYVIYNSPIWRLRVGDFQRAEDATVFLRKLKQEFPRQSREMFIVSDEVKISLND